MERGLIVVIDVGLYMCKFRITQSRRCLLTSDELSGHNVKIETNCKIIKILLLQNQV